MLMYPQYKRRDVLEEYALSFFALLAEGQRAMYRRYQMAARIALLPNSKSDEMNLFLKQLELATKDPSDILKPSGKVATSEELKHFFGKI